MKKKLLYKDKAGNKLYVKTIKSRNALQYYAKNKQGRLINPSGLSSMLKKIKIKIRVPKKIGIHRVKRK